MAKLNNGKIQVTLYLEPQDHADIKARAKALRLNISAYLRMQALANIVPENQKGNDDAQNKSNAGSNNLVADAK